MRKFLMSVLLAGAAATPAIAAPHDWSDRQQTREDRQSERDDRQQTREDRQSTREDRQSAREDRAQVRAEPRSQRAGNAAQYSRPDRAVPQAQVRQNSYAGAGERADARADRQQDRVQAREQRIQQRDVRQQDMSDRRELRQSSRPTPSVMRDRNPLVVSDAPRVGTQPPLRAEHRRTPEVRWNTSWRNNHRYDWHNYRHHHRSLFHLGFYYDPYGWGYQPFSIGWRLWPSYYGSRYWINDPWMYRLPYAPPGYVWVRYWNDAMLVDTWTGTVVDMIPGFFW